MCSVVLVGVVLPITSNHGTQISNMITPPHHAPSLDNILTCQCQNTDHKRPHKTHPTACLTQDTNHHLTIQTIDHNTNILFSLTFYGAENHMQ